MNYKVDDNRIVEKEKLIKVCQKNTIKVSDFKELDESKQYLVFGSFTVVEEFLKYKESI
jgi:dihydrofolate synthase/folylpolyglutamate synthase